MPGKPGNTTPITFMPGDTSWKPIHIEGTLVVRCGSFASKAETLSVFTPLTAQSLLKLSEDGNASDVGDENAGMLLMFTGICTDGVYNVKLLISPVSL